VEILAVGTPQMTKDFHNFPADADDRNMNFHPNRSLYPDKKNLGENPGFL